MFTTVCMAIKTAAANVVHRMSGVAENDPSAFLLT